MRPGISVVMPMYNAQRHLREAIESVLAQSFGDFECLVYDDGSSDASIEIAREYERRDSRVRVRARPRRGYVPCLNEGLREAAAPLVARMDADDVSLTDRFRRQREYLERAPGCAVVGTDYEAIDEDGEPLRNVRHETEHERLLARLLAGELGVICHPSAMMRRELALAVGGYEERYETTEDLDLWFRLAQRGRLANVPEVLLRYRHHDRSVSHDQSHRQKARVDEIVTRGRARFGLPPLATTVWPWEPPTPYRRRVIWARWALEAGNWRTARKHASIARALEPASPRAWLLEAATFCPSWLIQTLLRMRRRHRSSQ